VHLPVLTGEIGQQRPLDGSIRLEETGTQSNRGLWPWNASVAPSSCPIVVGDDDEEAYSERGGFLLKREASPLIGAYFRKEGDMTIAQRRWAARQRSQVKRQEQEAQRLQRIYDSPMQRQARNELEQLHKGKHRWPEGALAAYYAPYGSWLAEMHSIGLADQMEQARRQQLRETVGSSRE
jgi:hypothetical protein